MELKTSPVAMGVVVWLADELEAFLQLGRAGIFHPEEVVRLERFAEACGFDGGEAMVDVVQEVEVFAELDAQLFKEASAQS